MFSLHVDTARTWRGGQNQALLTVTGLRALGHRAELVAHPDGVLRRRAAEGGGGAAEPAPGGEVASGAAAASRRPGSGTGMISVWPSRTAKSGPSPFHSASARTVTL